MKNVPLISIIFFIVMVEIYCFQILTELTVNLKGVVQAGQVSYTNYLLKIITKGTTTFPRMCIQAEYTTALGSLILYFDGREQRSIAIDNVKVTNIAGQ